MGVSSSGKKKTKFVSLYAQEGQDKLAVLLPGRHSCECLAQKHKLINNCVSCGRIVCEQEGSGPCLFCGSLVSFAPHPSFISLFLVCFWGFFAHYYISVGGLHKRGAGDSATRLQQKPETQKKTDGR